MSRFFCKVGPVVKVKMYKDEQGNQKVQQPFKSLLRVQCRWLLLDTELLVSLRVHETEREGTNSERGEQREKVQEEQTDER